jgi:large subunit ribosomal protein L18
MVSLTVFDPAGDKVVAAAESTELSSLGFPESSLRSTPAAYLTGYLAGLRAKSGGTTGAILDAGLRHPTGGGRVLSALKGLLDAGVEIPHGERSFPPPDRLNGKHLKVPLAEPLETFKGKIGGIVARRGGS